MLFVFFLFCFFLILIYFYFNEAFVKNFMRKLLHFDTNFQNWRNSEKKIVLWAGSLPARFNTVLNVIICEIRARSRKELAQY